MFPKDFKQKYALDIEIFEPAVVHYKLAPNPWQRIIQYQCHAKSV